MHCYQPNNKLWGIRKYLYSPQGLGKSMGEGTFQIQNLQTKTGISGRLGSDQQLTSVGGVWILSGTTQSFLTIKW